MCAGRVCLVPAANDFGVGAVRDFRAMKGSVQILNNYIIFNNVQIWTIKG